jgi:hypothetical protein
MNYSRPLAQDNDCFRPARDRRLIGRLRDLEVIDASDVLEDAVRGAVPSPPRRGVPVGPFPEKAYFYCRVVRAVVGCGGYV